MRIAWFILIAGFLMSSVATAEDAFLSARARALMAKLKVKEFSDKELRDRRSGVLSEQRFKMAGDLVVTHEVIAGTLYEASTARLNFSDQGGKPKGFAIAEYKKSAREAQVALFERLVMNSMPLEMIADLYEIRRDGPGDICIITKKQDRSGSRRVADESKTMFIRDNVLLSVCSEDDAVKAMDLARKMDQMLVEGNE